MPDRPGLSRQAYEQLPEGERYQPYVAAEESLAEFTVKAIVPGIVFGRGGEPWRSVL